MPRPDVEKITLARISRAKTVTLPSADPLGPELLSFFKHSIQKRQTKIGAIADCWTLHIPSDLVDHCSLEGFSGGTLRVIVDSSTHLYALKQCLLGGVEKQLLKDCRTLGLRKISLKSGRWYYGNGVQRKLKFD